MFVFSANNTMPELGSQTYVLSNGDLHSDFTTGTDILGV